VTGALSLSIVFTFVATLVNAAEKGSNLASLLGFPLIIPVILLLIKLFFAQSGLSDSSENTQDLMSLLGIDTLLLGLGIFLYPLIWRS
jgi:heme exporter protein B